MAKLEFTKMHGCGNDYIYVVAIRTRPADPAALSLTTFRPSLRHRRRRPDHARTFAQRRHPDGDVQRRRQPRRDVRQRHPMRRAAGLTRGASARKNPIVVETDCGPQDRRAETRRQARRSARRWIWASRFSRGAKSRSPPDGRIIDYPLRLRTSANRSPRSRWAIRTAWCSSTTTRIFGLSTMSNSRGWAASSSITRSFRSASTPNSSCRISRNHLKMRVWERGSGETLACGTGACAALVAAVLTGRADRKRDGRTARRQPGNRMARERTEAPITCS